MPAIVQLASFLIDMAMPLEQAFATPRVDVSPGRIVCDARLPEDVPRALVRLKPATVAEQRVTTEPFTLPTGITRNLAAGLNSGVAHIFSPSTPRSCSLVCKVSRPPIWPVNDRPAHA